jgi:hypothetical protein
MRSPDVFWLYCPLQWNTCVADTPGPHAKTAFRCHLLLKTVIVSSVMCFKKFHDTTPSVRLVSAGLFNSEPGISY